tara:strand:- start:1402 stop:1788 length:387 start_codon:yes stop_codon:yes gene_type:complete
MAQTELIDQTFNGGTASILVNIASGATEVINVSALANSTGETAARVNITGIQWTSAAGITVTWEDSDGDVTALQLTGNGNFNNISLPYATGTNANGDINLIAGSGVATAIVTLRKMTGFAERTDYSNT